MKVYKLQSKSLVDSVLPSYKEEKEFKKIPLNCKISVLENSPISITISCNNDNYIYYREFINIVADIIPIKAQNNPISKEKIREQISKTGNTPFYFENIEIDLDNNLFVPKFSVFNEIRRKSLEELQNRIISNYITNRNLTYNPTLINFNSNTNNIENTDISLLINILDKNFDYTTLYNINKLYIPLKYFLQKDYENQIRNICNKFNTYIYMPNIIRDNLKINFENIINSFNIIGFVISNIAQIETIKKYNLELIGNYTLNAYNLYTLNSLKNLGISSFCITPELNNVDTKNLLKYSNISSEMLVYGKIPFMTINYCLLGNSNKCYKECKKLCKSQNKFYIKDRIGLNFRIIPDNLSTITTIYNSKTTSFDYSEFKINTARINILDENPNQIQNIINTVNSKKRFEGKEFCRPF